MEDVILEGMTRPGSLKGWNIIPQEQFFYGCHERRTEKHFADVTRRSSRETAQYVPSVDGKKRQQGSRFRDMEKIDPSMLYIPLDLHSGNTASKLGLLTRK